MYELEALTSYTINWNELLDSQVLLEVQNSSLELPIIKEFFSFNVFIIWLYCFGAK